MNLKRIKGVGPQIEGVLNEKGIFHFDQIAARTDGNVTWMEASLSFPGRITRDSWVEQAGQLASGGETAFSRRVDKGEVPSSSDES